MTSEYMFLHLLPFHVTRALICLKMFSSGNTSHNALVWLCSSVRKMKHVYFVKTGYHKIGHLAPKQALLSTL